MRQTAELRAAQAEVATLEMDEGLADEQHAGAEQQADDEIGQDIGVSPCGWRELARMHPPHDGVCSGAATMVTATTMATTATTTATTMATTSP